MVGDRYPNNDCPLVALAAERWLLAMTVLVLILEPGDKFHYQFDPNLLCSREIGFGKATQSEYRGYPPVCCRTNSLWVYYGCMDTVTGVFTI